MIIMGRINESLKALGYQRLNKGDTFNFECSACGACCKNVEGEIILTPLDLYNATKYVKSLNLQHLHIGGISVAMTSIETFINLFCDWYEGETSKLPLVNIDMEREREREICPFLEDGRCFIHAVKPYNCALYPLGFVFDYETNEHAYYFDPTHCAGEPQEQTVQEWLEKSALLEYEEFMMMWHKYTHKMSLWLTDLSAWDRAKLLDFIFRTLYLNYDLDRDFFEQFDRNCRAILDKLQAHCVMGYKVV
jgi:Fe-S-cluster containining protein